MNIRQFTISGNGKNEDSCYICDKFGFVIDGATGLTDINITNYQTDAQWFSFVFRDYLINALQDDTKTISQIVKRGIVEVDKLYNSFGGIKDGDLKPSAAIAIFRIKGEYIEYFVLGDCSILLNGKNIQIITTKELELFDKQNIILMQELANKNNINVVDAKPLIIDALKNLRKKMNTRQGYWILADDVKAVDFANTGTIKKTDIKQIVVVSDGFSQIYDMFKIYTVEQLMEELYFGKNIEEIYQILYFEQEKDCFCNNFPRFKLRDDATLIEMQL